MSRLLNLDNILVHPKKKTFLKYNNLKNCFESDDKNEFNINFINKPHPLNYQDT